MPIPTTKLEFVKTLKTAYHNLDAEFDAVNSLKENDKGIEGDISCCDVVAYQIGWTDLLLGWEQKEKDGKEPEMPAKGFKWNQLGELAQSFYKKSSGQSLLQLRKQFKKYHDDMLSWIESLSEQELFQLHHRNWTGNKWPIAKWIQVNSVAPYKSARTKVRRWKKENKI